MEIEEVYYKLDEKYSRETIHFVYWNFFKIFEQVLYLKEACIYISNFGYFFLSAQEIKKRLDRYKRMKLPEEYITPVEELLERSMKYPLNRKHDSSSNKQ